MYTVDESNEVSMSIIREKPPTTKQRVTETDGPTGIQVVDPISTVKVICKW